MKFSVAFPRSFTIFVTSPNFKMFFDNFEIFELLPLPVLFTAVFAFSTTATRVFTFSIRVSSLATASEAFNDTLASIVFSLLALIFLLFNSIEYFLASR
jgi:hypothetical protein